MLDVSADNVFEGSEPRKKRAGEQEDARNEKVRGFGSSSESRKQLFASVEMKQGRKGQFDAKGTQGRHHRLVSLDGSHRTALLLQRELARFHQQIVQRRHDADDDAIARGASEDAVKRRVLDDGRAAALELLALRVENPVRDTRAFQQVQAHLRQLPPALTTEQATRNAGRPTGTSGSGTRLPGGGVEAPASSYRTYTEGNLFRVSVPANWRELAGGTNTVTFAPEGAYGADNNGQSMFTHGVEIGEARNESHDLQTATNELLDSLAQGNPGLSRPSGYDRVKVGGRQGLRAMLTNTSAAGRPENIAVFTSQLRDGSLFYAVAVAPRDEFPSYSRVFDQVIRSIQLID